MKKNYIYFLAPLAALVIFGAIYWNFLSGYEKREEARALVLKQKKQEKLQAEEKAKQQAYTEAIAAQAKRKKDKEAKEAKEQADRDARQQAGEDRDQARREQNKAADKVRDRTREIESVKKEMAAIEEDKKRAVDEEAFLRVYVKQAEANRAALMAVLEKIQKADDDAAAAARLAAAAAKNKN